MRREVITRDQHGGSATIARDRHTIMSPLDTRDVVSTGSTTEGKMVGMDLRRQIDHAADIKGELVDFAMSPGFARLLAAETADALEHIGDWQTASVSAVENMLFERPRRGGKTVLERFLLGHKELPAEARSLLEDWRDREVYGVFEVSARKGDRLSLVNLVDELPYDVFSSMGAAAISSAKRGDFVLTRVLPVGDVWTLSGAQRVFGKDERQVAVILVAGLIEVNPAGPFRNPAKLEQALKSNRAEHDLFLGLFGADSVSGTGREAGEHFRRFTRECTLRAQLASQQAPNPSAADVVADDEYEQLDEELLESDDVVLLHHPVQGFGLFQNYSRVEEAHRRPPSRANAPGVRLAEEFLDDDTIPVHVLTRLASEFPDTVDRLYRLVLGRPEFRWESDGDALMRERKPESYATAQVPALIDLPPILAEAMRAGMDA